MANIRILITGANGQLGQEFKKFIKQSHNEDFIATDKTELDITNLTIVKDFLCSYRPNVVINCAGYNDVDGAESHNDQCTLINAIGPKNLAIVAESLGVQLVHFSTDYVFNGEAKDPYTIADLPSPVNRYGLSKLLGERFIQSLSRKYFIIRTSCLFGIGGENNFPRKVIDWSKANDKLKVVADHVGCPSYAPDIVRATFGLISTGSYGLYHMTNEGYCSRFEWAKFIMETVGSTTPVIPTHNRGYLKHFSEAYNIKGAVRPKFTPLNMFPLNELLGHTLPAWQDATKRFLQEWGIIK
jgi:dTDP-4-dehydrorhamnose reductase